MESLRARPQPHELNGNGSPSLGTIRIDAIQFCELAVSGRNLIRCDDGPAGMRGLVDTDTGEKFFVEESVLFGFAISGD